MPVCHSRRQIGQVPTDNEGLSAKLCRGVGDIDAVAIGEHPIGYHKCVVDGLDAAGQVLAEMEQVVPWARLVDRLRPLYPKGERDRPPIGLERRGPTGPSQSWGP